MPTMTLLGKQTVGSAGASSITFSSIPQTYTDLIVKWSTRGTANNGGLSIRFNGDTSSSNYYYIDLHTQNGTSVQTFNQATYAGYNTYIYAWAEPSTFTASTFSNGEMYLPNYTSTSVKKAMSIDSGGENNATAAYLGYISGTWTSTSAITSINIQPDLGSTGSNFAQYSTFLLYGVSTTNQETGKTNPSATGGDIVVSDGTYWYHAFINSGNFIPSINIKADVLVVAGGGSGATVYGGGGGAGGVLAFASQSLLANNSYTSTVGAGGAGVPVPGSYASGNNGGISQFSSFTASVGGGGGNYIGSSNLGIYGGSGGGSGAYCTTGGGGSVSGQGNNGGAGGANLTYTGAGGGGGAGGAGSAGLASSTSSGPGGGGAGGAGTNSVTNWGSLSSVLTTCGLGVSGYIAGGGGGGGTPGTAGYSTGGSGGGGTGGKDQPYGNSSAGSANTGSGGGGGGNNGGGNANGGAGGSGLVIVRYPV